MTRPIAAPNMHWAVLILGMISLSAVRGAVWIPIPLNFAALNMPTMGAWTEFTSPDVELVLLGDAGVDQLLSFLTLRTTDPPTIDLNSVQSSFNSLYPNKVRDHTATIYGSPQAMFIFGGVDANGNYLNVTLGITRGSALPNGTSISKVSNPVLQPRGGHTAVPVPQGSVGCAGSRGCILIFGGSNAGNFYTDMQRVDPVTFATAAVAVTNPPSGRAHHTAIAVNGKMYVMGGEDNAGNVLKETRIFDLSTSTWSNGAGMPVTLTGQAAVAMGTEIYVFGGRVAPSQLSNKLYIYNTINDAWSTASETEYVPTPRIYTRVAFMDANRFLIYGGNNGTHNLNDFVVYDLSKPCPFFCPYTKLCESEASCAVNVGCYNRTEDSALFKCRLECITDPRNCVAESCADVTCWNGLCADSVEQCEPYPRCPLTWQRCGDGLCSTNCDPFDAAQLCNGTLCVDGTCASDASACFPFNGCLPGLIQCPSGECASELEDCYCANSTINFACANYAADCAADCGTARWMKAAISADLTVKISKQDLGDLGRALVYREGREEVLAAVVFNATSLGGVTSAALSVRPVPESRFSRARYPLWSSDEDYRRKILSTVVEINSDQPANTVLLFFDFNLSDGLGRLDRCLARLVESTVNGTESATWSCVETNFPMFDSAQLMGALIDQYGAFALIAIKIDTAPADTQQPFTAPTNYEPEAHMGIAITAGGLLLGLIIVVVVRSVQQRA